MTEFGWTDAGIALGALFGLFAGLAGAVLSLTWLERKTLARIQQRAGPSVVGPHGLLQPLADMVKLVTKEDVIPAAADRALFWAAPLVVAVPAFLLWIVIPFANDFGVRSLELGLLFLIAVSGIGTVGLLMAGWTAASKYSMLGGFRAAAHLVSYEIPIIFVVLSVAVLVQSLDLGHVISGHAVEVAGRTVELPGQSAVPFAVIMPLGLIVFFLAGLAEIGRTPFDIHHAESEVVGGPFVEYSGAHWAALFLAEYMNTFLVAALTVLLFFGGWSWPAPPESVFGADLPVAATRTLGASWFLFKAYLVTFAIFWIRGTYPRLRIDQLMAFGWQTLIPLSFVNLILVAAVVYYGWPMWAMSLLSLPFIGLLWAIVGRRTRQARGAVTVKLYRKAVLATGGHGGPAVRDALVN